MQPTHNNQQQKPERWPVQQWRPPKLRFRCRLFLIPALTSLTLMWFFSGIGDVAFEWTHVLEWLDVKNTDRYTKLAVLAAFLILLLLGAKVLRSDKN